MKWQRYKDDERMIVRDGRTVYGFTGDIDRPYNALACARNYAEACKMLNGGLRAAGFDSDIDKTEIKKYQLRSFLIDPNSKERVRARVLCQKLKFLGWSPIND